MTVKMTIDELQTTLTALRLELRRAEEDGETERADLLRSALEAVQNYKVN